MNILRLSAATCASFLLAPAALHAQDPTAGHATLGAETATFRPPVGLFDGAHNRVSIAFFSDPPASAAEAAARKSLKWEAGAGGPAIIVDLTFAPDSTNGLAQQLRSCRVAFRGFKRGPRDLEGGVRECHVVSTGGLLREGGAFVGLMEGRGADYALRLPFSVTLPAAAPAESAGAAPATAAAGSAIPANSVSGSASYAGQRLRFAHGLAWWNAEKNQVSLAFFDQAPPPGMLAELRAESWGEGGPSMVLDLRFEGTPRPDPAAVTYCYASVTWPKGGPMGHNSDGRGCGLRELSGDLRAGGRVAATVDGQATGPDEKPYAWSLAFNLPIAR